MRDRVRRFATSPFLSVGVILGVAVLGVVYYYSCSSSDQECAREEEIAARIAKAGGRVTWTAITSPRHDRRPRCVSHITGVDLVGYNPFDVRHAERADDSLLEDVSSLTRLTEFRARLASRQLHLLSGLKSLRILEIVQEGRGVLRIRVVKELPNIEILALDNVSLRAEDIAAIGALPRLRSLRITSWTIEDLRLGLAALQKNRPDLDVTTGAFTLGCE